jgi:hypothetical protein
LVILNDYLLMIIDRLLSDSDDDSKKNKLIDLNSLHSDLWLDGIELKKVVVVECNHHVLHNVILDDLICYEDDQQNDLNVQIVFVAMYLLLLLLVAQ